MQRFGEMTPERKIYFAPVNLQTVEAYGTFSVYASVFGRVDLGQDLVMPGAFRECLSTRDARGVKLLFQHNTNEPVGVWLELAEDGRGFFANGRFLELGTRQMRALPLSLAGFFRSFTCH